MFLRIGRTAIAIIIAVASLPLAAIAETSGFGLDAYLLIPTCCVGYWLSLTSIDRDARVGWFVLASVMAFLLRAYSAWEWLLIDKILRVVQGYLREALPEFYSLSEGVAVVALIVLPWGFSCLMGWVAARLVRRVLDQSEKERRGTTVNFTLRGLLMSMAVIGGLTAWLGNNVMSWRARGNADQQTFVTMFKQSFTTGKVRLLGEPKIVGERPWQLRERVSYRVSAPIMKNGKELWAVWTYWCSENNPRAVVNFGYAEARTEAGLPPYPFPEYLNPTNDVSFTDGEPKQTVKAELVKAPSSARHGSTIEIIAKTDRWMECELEIEPFYARNDFPVKKIAPESGIVSFEVPLDPKFRGSTIEYKIICRTNPIYRANSVGGAISLSTPGDEHADAQETSAQSVLEVQSTPRSP